MKNSRLPLPSLLLNESEGRAVDWEKIFLALFQKKLKTPEIKALLLLTAKKGIAAPEIWGSLRALRRIEHPRRPSLPFLMDVCGTGGDGKRTFNVSTVASFVIAGAGGYVAKHGNRGVSSRVGSSDLMEALDVRLDLSFSRWLEILRECRLAYFHAPFFHPSFAGVQAVRRNLGIRTLFNLLGPLVNPVELNYQMVGVSRPEWLSPVAEALKRLGRKRAAVCRSRDGLDELSTSEASDILYLAGGRIQKMEIHPQKLGFSKTRLGSYEGGSLAANRRLALEILKGRLKGPAEDIVVLNSGFALWLAGMTSSVEEGIRKSRRAIQSGRAWRVLESLRRSTAQKR